jgi:hypothetical protein
MPYSRQTLKDYSLRKLGFPVININVDDDQVDDRVDEAINMFQQYHFDGTNMLYLNVTVDANTLNVSNTSAYHCFTLPNTVIGVSRVFPILSAVNGGTAGNFNIFDVNYQIRMNELYDFTSADYVYYELAQQHLRTLEMVLIGEPPIRYNRHDNKLYIDMKWDAMVVLGTKIVIETFSVLPENNLSFWNDNWLKKYTTCLIKEQWANNLKKFKGVTLPGNVMLDGQGMYQEAIAEKADLERELHEKYEEPPAFLMG